MLTRAGFDLNETTSSHCFYTNSTQKAKGGLGVYTLCVINMLGDCAQGDRRYYHKTLCVPTNTCTLCVLPAKLMKFNTKF